MRALYRNLDVCQKRGTTVFLTDWGCEPQGRVPDVQNTADPQYAKIIAAYVNYLVNKKRYTCIKHFIMTNEPNGRSVGDWDRWKKGVQNVSAEFRKHGLEKKVLLTGSDEVFNDEWHQKAVDQLQHILGAYDVHHYANEPDVRAGKLYDLFSRLWQYALSKDPNAKNKPLVVAEAGACKPVTSAHNRCHLDFDYGVLMSDYAVQAANAGSWAVLAWMLDDNSWPNFTWGMWKDKAGGLALKPWFYPWSLLCRYFPAGSRILSSQGLPKNIRLLAATRHGEKNKTGGEWSFCVVNSSETSATFSLRVSDGPVLSMRRYVYSKASAKADDHGFPLPLDDETYDLNHGIMIDCSPNTVTVLTSMK